ncbi:aminotransferase class I/II-fold pyridoxal phosphate-dependent enzyme [soil metagenome]
MPTPLEPDQHTRRDLLAGVVSFLDDFYSHMADLPVSGVELDDARTRALSCPPPEEGRSLDDALGLVALANQSGSLHPSGGHMAYIPNGGLFTGALGAFLAAGLNRYTGVAGAAPGLAVLEDTVVRWLGELFELPEGSSGGVLLSGGSMANLTAIVAARTRRLPEDFLTGTIYVSSHVHHSVTKAARLAGFPARAVRTVPTDVDLRMDVDELMAMVDEDRHQGRRPFLLVGSAGTTDTGTVDPLADLAAVAHEQGLWLHIDAAYGGFFQLTDRGRKRLVGIGAGDSVTLDPHKGLSIPFGVGALLARDRTSLLEAHDATGAYLQDHHTDTSDFSSLGPELTRPFRGMHVWLPLQVHGVGAFRTELDEALDLAEHAYERLRLEAWVEQIWRPDLSIVAFRAFDDEAARRALEATNASGEVYLSSTSIRGRYTLRLAILNRRTELAHVDAAIDLLSDHLG